VKVIEGSPGEENPGGEYVEVDLSAEDLADPAPAFVSFIQNLGPTGPVGASALAEFSAHVSREQGEPTTDPSPATHVGVSRPIEEAHAAHDMEREPPSIGTSGAEIVTSIEAGQEPRLQPGWFPDPNGTPNALRYFDGTTWTDHVATPSRSGLSHPITST